MRIEPTLPPARLTVAWLTMFLVGTELFVFSPLLPLLAATYNISAAIAGLSVTIFSLTYMVSAPAFGHLSDRIGRRRVLIYSLLGFAAANLLTASVASLPSLLAARVLAGAAAAGISPSIYALVGSAAPPDRRATWLALVVSGLLLSLALGASAGALVGAFLGWMPLFMALAAASSMLLWLNCRVWPHDAVPASASADPLAGTVLARRLLPTVVWSTGLYGVYTYLGTGLYAVGFSTGRIAQAIVFYGCGAIAGVLIGGPVADRLGVKLTAGASLAGLCACLLLLRLALDADVFVEPVLGVSSAVAQLFFPAQQAGLANDFPRQRGAVLAWNNSALFFGISLGSFVGGQAVAWGDFNANLSLCAGIALIGCILTAMVVPGSAPFRANRVKDRHDRQRAARSPD
jgi:predicted MFS family arabinose efflux permease